MPTALESQAVVRLLVAAAVRASRTIMASASAAPSQLELASLFGGVRDVVDYYSLGSATLAADFYADERDRARAPGRYVAQPLPKDRTERIGQGIGWALKPLAGTEKGDALSRMAGVVQLATSQPYRDTIIANRARDPAAVGWRRVTRGDGCKLCLMLADRGAVYSNTTARFATHEHCTCSAQPVFSSEDYGEPASVMQRFVSEHKSTPESRARLREYLDREYPDAHG